VIDSQSGMGSFFRPGSMIQYSCWVIELVLKFAKSFGANPKPSSALVQLSLPQGLPSTSKRAWII
jgi:hypothetical protein